MSRPDAKGKGGGGTDQWFVTHGKRTQDNTEKGTATMPCTLPNMGHRFDKVAKALATGVSRRDAFKYVGAGVLAAMLANVGVREAEAARCQAGSCGACPPIIGCQGHNSSDDQCVCLTKVKAGACLNALRAKCIQNASCAGLIACSKGSVCKGIGLNWKCIDGACCGILGLCGALCGTVPPCCSAQGGPKARSLASLAG